MADPSSNPADPALDFLSASFDPALALSTPNLEPPDPNARPLDNVAKCRSILPAELPESLANVEKRTASEASRLKAGQFKERAARLAQRIQEGCQLSLERVVASIKPGPIRVLGQWMASGARVRVVTRHARGVRGVATGLLMAYDRFMNVVLKDVEEEYTVRMRVMRTQQGNKAAARTVAAAEGVASTSSACALPQGVRRPEVVLRPNPASADEDPVEPGELGEVVAEAVEKVRWSHRQDHRRRHLAQVFIKGDNIVMVSLTVNPEAPLTRVDPEARGKAAG